MKPELKELTNDTKEERKMIMNRELPFFFDTIMGKKYEYMDGIWMVKILAIGICMDTLFNQCNLRKFQT